MPKVPGRPDTRLKVKIEEVEIGSFIMEHETRYWRKVCAIEGCDHRMGPDPTQHKWYEWKSCDERQLPGFLARKVDGEYVKAGIACPCCTAKILDQ